jgi:DNA-binding Lrp family transcriptional regulator
VDAYLYVRARPGKAEEIVEQLQALRGVHQAVLVIGDWDVLASVHGPDLVTIAAEILRSIHHLDGVVRTLTTPVVPADATGLAGRGLGATAPLSRIGDACFVKMRIDPESTVAAYEALVGMEHVAGVAIVAGDADLLVEIPYGWEEASRVILGQLLRIPGVRSTDTLVAVPYVPPDEEDRDQFSAWI